jgi:DNA-binding Lrp family transcriptional regulator
LLPQGGDGVDALDFQLLNDYQRDLPLVPAPFARIGSALGIDEAAVITRLAALQAAGMVSRVGTVFAPRRVGASTLAALAVPPARLAELADRVSAHAEVNHNYEREHVWNLWFVATALDNGGLATCLSAIRRETRCPMLRLPLEAEYHIDLGFDLAPGQRGARAPAAVRRVKPHGNAETPEADRRIMTALQEGLPLQPRPFEAVAASAGASEGEVLATLQRWLDTGILKRFGVVVRHHELGYCANAMCVWEAPADEVDALGQRLAAQADVTLCYRRRPAPGWPFNLYCMIHGRDRATVAARVAALERDCGLAGLDGQILFSLRRFKQCGARYVSAAVANG